MNSPRDLFKNLFRNASECESKAPIITKDKSSLLPECVNGSRIIYNGPVGKWDFEKESARHWFDGMSILTAFDIDREKNVSYLLRTFHVSCCWLKKNKQQQTARKLWKEGVKGASYWLVDNILV